MRLRAVVGPLRAGILALLTSVGWAEQARGEVFFGPEVRDMAMRSVDAMRMHQQVMVAQLRLDDTLWHFGVTARGMPATIQFAGGEQVDAGLNRLSLSLGGGFGRPSEAAFSFGLQAENIGVSSWPLILKGIDGYPANNAQAVYYVAFASNGLQLSGGGLAETGFTGLDAAGRFSPDTSSTYSYRAGAPPDLVAAQQQVGKRQRSNAFFFSLTQREGVLLGGTFAQVRKQIEDEGSTRLAALRAQLRPERWVKQAMAAIPGIPSIGFDLFASGVDPYADRYKDLRRRSEQIAASQLADTLPSPSSLIQLPLALENIRETGAHLRVVPQVAPNVTLRMVDGGIARRFGSDEGGIEIGARATAFQRSGGWTGSAEALAGVTSHFYTLRIGYAYNVPDAAVLLPIPNAHVIGLQVVYGRAEVALPLLPIASTLAQLAPTGKESR